MTPFQVIVLATPVFLLLIGLEFAWGLRRERRGTGRPDGHLKLLHSWPPKLPQAGRIDYGAATGLKAIREAASLSL